MLGIEQESSLVGVEAIVLEEVGHFAMLEAPDRFNQVLAATPASFD